MKKDLITIILPVYNSEKYLAKCIDSILNQTYDNFELIIVDDGSKDNTNRIVTDYTDKRLKYVYSKHYGVSSARNIGLKKSKGKYIAFIDSDDEVASNFLELLYNNYSNNIQLSVCGYTKKVKNYSTNKGKKVVDRESCYEEILNKKIGGYIWNKLFVRKIIMDNNLIFSEKLTMGEDLLFLCEYLKYCKNISIDFNKCYFYRKNVNQVSRRYDQSISSVLFGWIGVMKIYEEMCPQKKVEIEYRYLKKLTELKKVIERKFHVPKINIDKNKFTFKQKLVLKLYSLFARQIVFIKRGI